MLLNACLVTGQLAALTFALGAAILWPRAGEPAQIIATAPDGFEQAVAWAAREDARLITLDSRARRMVVELPSTTSALTALQYGLLPIASGVQGCAPQERDPMREGTRT